MNERIAELMTQAGLETQPAKLKIMKNDDGTVTSGGWEYPIENFAELIVQECVKIAYQYDIAKFTRDGYQIGIDIQKHFGIEE